MKLTFLTRYFLDSLFFKISVPFYYISKVPILCSYVRSELCTLESSRLAQIFPIYRQYFPSAIPCVWLQEAVGPGWVARDLSEIKPGAFSAMRSLETRWANQSRPQRSRDPRPPIRLEKRDERREEARELATSDPMYRYYKRLLPPARYTITRYC